MAISEAVSAAGEILAIQWPFVATIAVASTIAWLFRLLMKGDPLSKMPLIGGDIKDEAKRRTAWATGAKEMYKAGYDKFRTGVFRVPSQRESPIVVVGPQFLRELKDLPDDTVSFNGAIVDLMHSKYTNLLSTDNEEFAAWLIKRDLTPALNRLNPVIAEEVDECFQEELPPCKEWTKVSLNHKLLRIVAKVSGRIFVGPEICRTEEYVDMGINYTIEMGNATKAISELKAEDRPAKAPLLKETKVLAERRKRSLNLIRPLIESRKKAAKEDSDYQKPDDLMQWALDDGQAKFGEQSEALLSELQLGLTFAAIHTTTLSATNAIYTLAAMPELIPEIREEISSVLKEYGTFTAAALQKMKKLDSFLREVARVYPLGWASFQRKVTKTFTLSSGQVIPKGVIIEVPSHSMAHDPEIYPNPHQFDAFRSYRAREQEGLAGAEKAGAGAANQLVTISATNLNFGWGRHACPGRFFAANEIKMIIGRALLDYDIKLVDGVTERYKNFEFNEQCIPDPSKEIMFKRVAI